MKLEDFKNVDNQLEFAEEQLIKAKLHLYKIDNGQTSDMVMELIDVCDSLHNAITDLTETLKSNLET